MLFSFVKFATLLLLQGCIFFLPLSGFASDYSRKAVEKHILRFEFDTALKLLSECPDPYAKAYYINHIHFFRVLATDDQGYKNRFYQSCDQSFQVFDKMPKSNAYKKYYQAEVYFLRGVVYFLSKKYVAAGLDLNASYSRIKSNMSDHPELRANYKLMGLYEAGLSAIPGKYQYITNLLGFKGDLMKGMEKMRIAARTSEIFPQEAEMLSCYAERKLMDNTDQSLSCMRSMYKKEPDNILYAFFLGNIAVNNRRSAEALICLNNLEQWKNNKQVFYIQFLDYLRGKALFYQLNYTEALKDLNHFITHYNGFNFKGDALFKRALIYELKGDHETARTLFLEIAQLEKNDFDLDNYAIRYAPLYAEKPFTRDEANLQKARNLFDGGFFDDAVKVLLPMLKHHSELSDETLLELNYRMGRVHQEQNKLPQAKLYYQIAMGNKTDTKNPAFWMKVYSVYHLGGIWEDEGNASEATRYYKMALGYKDYLYQNDLEQMAKAGVERMKPGKK